VAASPVPRRGRRGPFFLFFPLIKRVEDGREGWNTKDLEKVKSRSISRVNSGLEDQVRYSIFALFSLLKNVEATSC